MSEESTLPAVVHQDDHYELFDLADEEQIIAELSGRVTEKFVYELKGVKDAHGNPVTGLSYAGTNWACREYAKQGEVIRVIGKPDYQVDPTDPDYVLITVMAQRFAVHPETGKETALDTAPGAKRQWRKMKRAKWENGQKAGDEIVDDPFFWEKGLSKATRNAKQALIPTDIVKRLVEQAVKAKKAGPPREGHAQPRPQQPQRPPPASKPAQAAAQGPAQPAAQGPAQPASQAPAQASQPPAQGQAAKPAQSKDTLIQKFEVVLKGAFKTQDAVAARQALKRIAGTDRIGDLSEEDLKKYGKILQGVPSGAYKVGEGGAHIEDAKTGEVVWGTKPEPAEAAPAPTASEPAAEENLF